MIIKGLISFISETQWIHMLIYLLIFTTPLGVMHLLPLWCLKEGLSPITYDCFDGLSSHSFKSCVIL
ncbi:hypothetical protein RchiOBHm_Chr7g0224341 [Rosa chinensis]|uniref:Uncharacterized protein n=1 Tax=Rosa chinensis TaxID=74649 RepID=A0A2P6PDT2_ROSCH|nr:hypothetical protein RchiOBHm_Chr7g0224341 [Rosa chinensis]